MLPRLYVLNAASLAKPHAIEQLAMELVSLSIDIALITETHFKKHHSDGAFYIEGFSCVRRDRVGRRGGGVAIFIKDTISYIHLSLS